VSARYGRIGRERIIAGCWGVLFTVILALLIIAGSRNLQHFDAALVGYTFAVLFATFAITYRYSMWLQRPPTRRYWVRGWQMFFRRGHRARNAGQWVRRVAGDFALNRFIAERGLGRWLAHWLIMWGCVTAFAITFPLVFGWIHFETIPGQLHMYRAYLFGFPGFAFPIESLAGFMLFHGLVWSSFLVIAGVMVAMRRRMRDHGAAALQKFGEDFLPLILLFAISITGLMLTASYSWMKGYGYEFLALLHAATVIFTLLYLPFGKFFHIFQRPAQLGVSFYRDVAAAEAMAACVRCAAPFAPLTQIEDLIDVERELGYRYEVAQLHSDTAAEPSACAAVQLCGSATHYQRICPSCRRSLMAIAQGRLANQ